MISHNFDLKKNLILKIENTTSLMASSKKEIYHKCIFNNAVFKNMSPKIIGNPTTTRCRSYKITQISNLHCLHYNLIESGIVNSNTFICF